MRRLTTFQRLALWTTAATYFLILVGGLVRASGAGLGCPDWPRCFGSWIPPLSAAELPARFDRAQFNPALMWTEYLNRLLGVTVGLLICATLIAAVRHHRRTPHTLWPTVVAFLLVGFEGWLGGRVVAHELAPWIVTVHLIVALVIVSLLLYATVYAFFGERAPARLPRARRAIVVSSAALIAMTLVQVALGAEVRGGIDEALIAGTTRSAALSTVGSIDYWHRDMALVVFAVSIVVTRRASQRRMQEAAIVRAAYLVAGLAVSQIVLGITLAYLSLTPPVQIAHLTVASLLLGAETLLLLLARWLPCE